MANAKIELIIFRVFLFDMAAETKPFKDLDSGDSAGSGRNCFDVDFDFRSHVHAV